MGRALTETIMRKFNYCVVVLTSLIAISGCTKPTAAPLILPDGGAGLIIRCGGSNLLISDCYTKAGEMCPIGYSIVTSDTSDQPSFMATPTIAIASSYTAREMLVKCRSK